ncbi:hypothetical protein GCM10007071_29490 [Marinobacter zhanjiangensis]|uniref:Uncharacterized protein n=1 Tax=Marinobacter zhanjiangensis TaxID=578215 RepID=A0ABQ3B642_9GAMM|nr:hypothetical protein GCM10007071_29490 [Marinobacter zhanjiangensis]
MFDLIFLDDVLLVAGFHEYFEELQGNCDKGDYAKVFWSEKSGQDQCTDNAEATLNQL